MQEKSSIRKTGITKWFLGFDCATKTLAFSLSRISLPSEESYRSTAKSLRATALLTDRATECMNKGLEYMKQGAEKEAKECLEEVKKLVGTISQCTGNLDKITRNYVRIIDGETVDLFPEIKDKEIPTVMRIRGLHDYVEKRVKPCISKHVKRDEQFQVVIEFQAGMNAPARKISDALIVMFITEDVVIVGPSLKNKIHACEKGKYCYFVEKYKNSYDANKAHTKFNFAYLESTFGSEIPSCSAELRGHIADSFMQVVGHMVHGGTDEEARKRY